MAEPTHPVPPDKPSEKFGGAVGAGLVLIVLPCVASVLGMRAIGERPIIGLPILAIFGIMILFGTLALIATLFARLQLSDPSQALALPEGSVRAAIAMALIVLFAIISIMLYQSISEPYEIKELSETDKAIVVREAGNRGVLAVIPQPCMQGGSAIECKAGEQRYTVHLRQPQGQESTDLAKQLLILIGTLMTSVTSFYFASRTVNPMTKAVIAKLSSESGDGAQSRPPRPAAPDAAAALASAGSAESAMSAEEGHDGCDVPIVDVTPDEELPPAKGGVA